MWRLIESIDIDDDFEKKYSKRIAIPFYSKSFSQYQYRYISLPLKLNKNITIYSQLFIEYNKGTYTRYYNCSNNFKIIFELSDNYYKILNSPLEYSENTITYDLRVGIINTLMSQKKENYNLKFYTREDIFGNHYLKIEHTDQDPEITHIYQVMAHKCLKYGYKNDDLFEVRKLLSRKLPNELVALILNYTYDNCIIFDYQY